MKINSANPSYKMTRGKIVKRLMMKGKIVIILLQ
jgi:hypothetical protein